MTTTAIIPARAGSTRLLDKNMADFLGEPLLVRKVKQLLPAVDQVIVWSDSETYLMAAKAAGAVIVRRELEWADEKTHTFGDRVAHICSSSAVSGEIVLWAPCTSPLVSTAHYAAALDAYNTVRGHGFDSVMSVVPIKRYLWDQRGPINYALGVKHVRSQDLPDMYFVADAIQIAKREDMIRWKYFHGPHPFKFVLDKRTAVDIDDELDLKCALAWAKQ